MHTQTHIQVTFIPSQIVPKKGYARIDLPKGTKITNLLTKGQASKLAKKFKTTLKVA